MQSGAQLSVVRVCEVSFFCERVRGAARGGGSSHVDLALLLLVFLMACEFCPQVFIAILRETIPAEDETVAV